MRHGFTASTCNILDLDDSEEARRYVQMWLVDLAVVGQAEEEVGTSIALKRRRLARLEGVEDRRLHAEVLLRLDGDPAMQALKLCQDTITAIEAMTGIMGSIVPADRDALDALLVPVGTVLGMLERVVDLDPTFIVGLRALTDAVGTLKQLSPEMTHIASYEAVVGKAGTCQDAVRALLPDLLAAVEAAKERISSELPIPDDKDVNLRRRYRGEIAKRIQADVLLLGHLQELRRAREAASGSFRAPVAVRAGAGL